MGLSPDAQRRAWIESCFAEHAAGLYVYLSRLTGDDGDAESLTQECFLRLCASKAEFPHPGALRAWLYRVARNLAFDRSKRRRPHLLDAEGQKRIHEQADSQACPSTALELGEDVQRLRAALADLPELYRSTLVLRFLDEWSYEDLADLEQVSVSALRTRIHKGLRLLRELLEPRPSSSRTIDQAPR